VPRSRLPLLNLSRLISTAGDQFYFVALAVALYDLTGSSLATLLVMAIRGVVHTLGIFFYRSGSAHRQRAVVIGGDATRAVLVLALIPALAHSLPTAYLVVAAIEVVQLYYGPARIVIVDQSGGNRTRAHNTDMIVSTVALTLGLLFSGLAYEAWGLTVALTVDAVSFTLSALIIWYTTRNLPALRAKEGPKTAGPLGSVRWIWRQPAGIGRTSVLLAPLSYLPTNAFNGLLVVWALAVLHGTARTYAVIEAAMAIGLLAGSLLAGRVLRERRIRTVGMEFVVMGALYAAAVLAGQLVVAVLLLGVSGAVNILFAMKQRLIVTRAFPEPADMARAWQFYRSTSHALSATGALVAGVLADSISITATMIGCSVLLVFSGLLLRFRTSILLDAPPASEPAELSPATAKSPDRS
jgi:predicted MFS family arabinose efflux permease